MTMHATLLMGSGGPDPAWQLTEGQEQTFKEILTSSPVPNTTISSAYHAAGYRGVQVRDGSGERWIVYRGWIRGGLLTRVDERHALELWLLETGRDTIAPNVLADLIRRVTPST